MMTQIGAWKQVPVGFLLIVFPIASVTKMFTVTSLGMLVDEGKPA